MVKSLFWRFATNPSLPEENSIFLVSICKVTTFLFTQNEHNEKFSFIHKKGGDAIHSN